MWRLCLWLGQAEALEKICLNKSISQPAFESGPFPASLQANIRPRCATSSQGEGKSLDEGGGWFAARAADGTILLSFERAKGKSGRRKTMCWATPSGPGATDALPDGRRDGGEAGTELAPRPWLSTASELQTSRQESPPWGQRSPAFPLSPWFPILVLGI